MRDFLDNHDGCYSLPCVDIRSHKQGLLSVNRRFTNLCCWMLTLYFQYKFSYVTKFINNLAVDSTSFER